ncbi:Olfactory receptor 1102 [Lemmus lemmus]
MCYTSATIPKAVVMSFTGLGLISYLECVTQLYMFITLASTECFLLTAMAYDRFLAIFRPLLYGTIMSHKCCVELVVTAWVSGAIYSAFHTFNTFSLPYCGPNVVEHFFCDIPPVMRLSCTDYHLNEEPLSGRQVEGLFHLFLSPDHSHLVLWNWKLCLPEACLSVLPNPRSPGIYFLLCPHSVFESSCLLS